MPVGASILKGVLASDLIGFHTYEYGRHFLSSCNRLLSLATLPTMVRVSKEHVSRVGIYPIGIDPDPFIEALELPSIQKIIEKLESKYGDQKIILGVDRLDYIKGIPHKLLGFEIFLRNYAQYRGKVHITCIHKLPFQGNTGTGCRSNKRRCGRISKSNCIHKRAGWSH